jgi:hypothetical protein
LQSAKPALQLSPHVLAVQMGVEFARVRHTLPQAPQFVAEVRRSISQPSEATPLQLAKPDKQVMPHVDDAQVRVAFARVGQALPHAPQWSTALRVSISQPSVAMPLQSPKPVLQRNPHALAVQVAVAFARPGQALPQAPQCEREVRVSTSHPSVATPLQLPKPALQLMPQALDWQVALAFARLGHTVPHAPQFAVSALVSTQLIEEPAVQTRSGAVQVSWQLPATHRYPEGQLLPQAPQCAVELRVSTSQPSVALPLQSAKPVVQVKPQTLALQVATEFARLGHALPQAPQCAVALRVSVSQPSLATALQSAKPALQLKPQTLAEQVAREFARLGHTKPQPPQCAVALRVSISQPSAATPLQSAKPVLQLRPQLPLAHTALALGPSGHTCSHAPQFDRSLEVSAQLIVEPAVHSVRGAGQSSRQLPITHSCPPGHALPQAPQCARSDCTSTQRPAHAVCPLGQPASTLASGIEASSPVETSREPSDAPSRPTSRALSGETSTGMLASSSVITGGVPQAVRIRPRSVAPQMRGRGERAAAAGPPRTRERGTHALGTSSASIGVGFMHSSGMRRQQHGGRSTHRGAPTKGLTPNRRGP